MVNLKCNDYKSYNSDGICETKIASSSNLTILADYVCMEAFSYIKINALD